MVTIDYVMSLTKLKENILWEGYIMAIEKINLEKGKAKRNMLAIWVDVQRGIEAANGAVWEPLGIGTEDAGIAYDYDETTTTDIWDATEALINTATHSISFDPYYIKAGDTLQAILIDILNREAWGELSSFKVLVARYYIGKEGNYQAMTYDACTIKVQSEGGPSYVSMQIDISIGGHKTMGTVNLRPPSIPVFTAV